ncbi:ATP-binding protein [Haliangium sp.]|uniref:hybrid sensor histidine kinase/response regulator n=1 Tax=Haliangium sp. TaxID=2663208 RepID=UPI003D099F38
MTLRRPRLNITGTFLLFLVSASIIPLVIVGVRSYDSSRRAIRDQAHRAAQDTLAERTRYLDLLSERTEALIANIADSLDIRRALTTSDMVSTDAYHHLVTQTQIGEVLGYTLNLRDQVSIDIFTADGAHYHVGDPLDGEQLRPQVAARLFEEADQHHGGLYWAGIEANVNRGSRHDQVIVAARALELVHPDLPDQRVRVHIVVNYDVSGFRRHFADTYLAPDAYTAVVDGKGRLLFHTDQAKTGQRMDQSFLRQLSKPAGTFVTPLDGREMFVGYDRSRKTGWLLASFTPVAYLEAESIRLRNDTMVLIGLCLVVITALAWRFSHRVVTPIRRLTRVFQRLEDGSLAWDQRMPGDRNDEIGELFTWFNLFLDNLAEKRRAETELLHAKEAAEAASEAKSQFLANMSHELRTPLNGIMGLTELSLTTALSDEQRDYLTMVHAAARNMLSLVSDLLDLSRIDTGHMALVPAPFRLREELGLLVRTLAQSAADKGLRLERRVADEVPDRLLGDASRLVQIILNLVTNAIKFTDEGEVRLTVEVSEPAPAEGGELELHIQVQDTGIGIAPETRERIFELFSQADMSNTRRHGGTGLGLALCQRLVRLMNGRLWLESEPGEGSTFHATVRLDTEDAPRARATTAAHAPTPSPSVTPALGVEALAAEVLAGADDGLDTAAAYQPLTAPTGAGLRPAAEADESAPIGLHILLVEDTPINQRVVTLMLERQGHTVHVAANGVEAVESLRESPTRFDLVLMDIQMPLMDGLEATAAIRRNERHTGTHVPIVAVTAHGHRANRERCLAAGMDAFLAKPVQAGTLLQVLSRLPASPQAPASES